MKYSQLNSFDKIIHHSLRFKTIFRICMREQIDINPNTCLVNCFCIMCRFEKEILQMMELSCSEKTVNPFENDFEATNGEIFSTSAAVITSTQYVDEI